MGGRSDEVETSDDVRPNDSCTEFYDLTKDFKTSTKRPKNDETSDRRNQRAPSQSRHETQMDKDKTFRKQLDSLLSVTWMKIKEKKRHARRSTSSDRSEENEREYRRHRKEKRKSRRSSPGKRYRSRSRSPYSRDTEREYYRKTVERRDSVERYRRSRSYERRVERRRSRSHERDSKHSRSSKKYKYSNEQVVKTEAVERFREENDENDSWYMEPERAPESRVSASLFDKLRQKIKSTLQNSSNRNANVPNASVDSTRQLDAQEWQDTFDLDSGSSSESTHKQIDDAETETQQESVGDNLRAMEKDSNNLVLDMNRKKIKFTFTKSTKTDTSQISSVFNPTATDNLTNARTKLGTLLRSALNDRSGKDDPKETSIETTPVQEHSSIDDDSIDHEIIQKIISQTQVHTSSSYELSVNVPVGFNSAAAVEMFENEMSSESQYTGSTRINSGAHTDAQAFTGPSVVNTTTTQVVRSNYSVTTRLNLPTPSTKFLPAVRKPALLRHHVNSFDHQPFNNAIGSRDQISEKATTYGEHKNRLALGNFKIPKISRSTSSVSDKSNKINENDSANYDRPTTSSQWKDSPQWNEELNIRCYRNPTQNDAAPKPVTNVSKMETARKSLMNYKIPKKTTKENGSMSSALTPVVEMKNVNQNDHKNRNKRPTKSQPAPAIESQIPENQESISRPISISSTSSDESNSGVSEITIDNDNKDWNNFERPQSNVDANVQPDKNPTGNETASPIADVSNEQNAMESLKDWMKTNEFATLVDLMQQLAQHKNLEKLKDALSNNNNAARNEEFGEGSSNAESVNATTNVSNGNTGNQKQSDVSKFKNIDTAWHSLRKILECQECDKPFGNSLVSHYVNLHPDCEVLTSRLAPEAAENLRSGIYESDIVVAKPPNSSSYHYKQFCYFCNVFRCYNKLFWINHMARHTGYYRLKCKDCSRKFACKTSHGKCFRLNNLEPIPQPQYKKRELLAYVCDLCNFVRFHQHEIEMHLCTEHGDGQKSKQFKKVTFLRFPNAENKYVRKNPVKKYKKRKPKPVEEFLSKLKESEAEIDLKEEIDSEYETDSDSDDDSVSDFGSDWSNMDVQDDDSLTFTETSSDSDFV